LIKTDPQVTTTLKALSEVRPKPEAELNPSAPRGGEISIGSKIFMIAERARSPDYSQSATTLFFSA
jgi:hypothetical protein